ncbi:UDP-N-acetylmuramate dehydrogenase [bacterium]|nr:UDP-N-acetylmuramate dehydrogenase [bacterium]
MKNLQKDVLLAPLTTFKIGGRAQLLLTLSDESDVLAAAALARESQLTPVILGAGSNVLIPDAGLPLVWHSLPAPTFNYSAPAHRPDGKVSVTVWSGTTMAQLAWSAIKQGLSGLELFAALPGTVGGGIWNNSHAGNQLVSDTLESVRFLDLTTGEVKDQAAQQLKFAYDSSWFHQHPCFIISGTFALTPGNDPTALTQKVLDFLARKRQTQPLSTPSAGCFWKNPDNTDDLRQRFPQFADKAQIPAGFLIEQCHQQLGKFAGENDRVIVSPLHHAFILNLGGGSSNEVLSLAAEIRTQVKKRFGVTLEPEVKILDQLPWKK